MSEKLRFVILLAGAMCSLTTASAGEPCRKLFGCPVPDCIGKWCCDDYRPKNEPCVCVPLRFGCDDYCAKKVPCVRAPLCFGCDDYRKKCLPKVCTKPLYQFLRCGPSRVQCGCGDCGGSTCDGSLASNVKVERATAGSATERIAARAEQVDDRAIEKPGRLHPVYIGQLPFELTE
jgi:hypothetical protein